MGSSIFNVAQSGLMAAQAGMTTTAHNIANANTPGYSRQSVIQTSAGAQDMGFGYLGRGTEIAEIRRSYNDLVSARVNQAQSSTSQLQTYLDQISQIDNQFSSTTAGLSPALQAFFNGMHDVAGNPASGATRQAALSSAETLAARFQSLNGQLQELGSGVNSQITSSVETINVYAQQIAKLNDELEKLQGGGDSKTANDLLDQRDYAVTQLNQQIKATVVKQGNSYNIFIGSGQPLVIGLNATNLVAMPSQIDPTQTTIGYSTIGGVQVPLSEKSLTGGALGGLLQFRSETLNVAQNALGRVAVTLATTFNAQHQLGQDQNGALGGEFFVEVPPSVTAAGTNNTASAASVSAAITDTSKLTTSDYKLQFTGGNYIVTRLSDNAQLYSNPVFPSGPDVIEGVTLSLDSGSFSDGDQFLIRPTANAARDFAVAITDTSKIAAASPIRTAAPTANIGTGKISSGTVNAPPPTDPNLQLPVSITFTSPTDYDIVDTSSGTTLASGTYTEGADISLNGWTVQITGAPATGDTFTVGPNTNGTGDAGNAVALAKLQSANLLDNGTSTYQGAYAQLISSIGNKTHELDITNQAESANLQQAVNVQQSESGVNLDEEAANLLRYQQAYQAAAKIMQTTNELFQTLVSLGGS